MQIYAISNIQSNQQNFGSAQTSFSKKAEMIIKRKFSRRQMKMLGHLMSEADKNSQYVQKIEFSEKGGKRLRVDISGKNDTTIIESSIQQGRFQPVSRFIKKVMAKAMDIENELTMDTIELF